VTGATPLRFVADAADSAKRLDQFLTDRLPGTSRAQVQRLIRSGCVQLTRGAAKPSLPVTPGLAVDVRLPPPEPIEPEAEALPLRILFDDDDVVVIDKPAGMVVHPAAGHARGTLVNALLHHVRGLSGIGGATRPGIVHRLDKGTSGVMVIAKNDRAHRALSAQFRDRSVNKEYLALVWGAPRTGETIERSIGRDPKHRQRMSSRARRGRAAVTHVLDVEKLGGVSLVRVRIGTGRTHQIRVHLSETGSPIVGDALYGGARRPPAALSQLARVDRPLLHAARLSFDHPADGRRLMFEAPMPTDMTEMLDDLRRRARR
jgi:23S rRNA pseudouridine1911/1915/1917 synthase